MEEEGLAKDSPRNFTDEHTNAAAVHRKKNEGNFRAQTPQGSNFVRLLHEECEAAGNCVVHCTSGGKICVLPPTPTGCLTAGLETSE